MGHTAASSDELIARVRKIAGQIAAVERALTSNAPCADVLHRVAAVRGALNGLLDEIIAAHLEAHVASPDLSDAARIQGAEELLAVIRRYSN